MSSRPARAPVSADLELPAASVDVARALDRSEPARRGLLLVGIELGGLMRSSDGGETWQDHRPGAQRDVHSLAWHPRVPGGRTRRAAAARPAAATAATTWQPADEGRDRHYTWSVAVDPDDPDCWYVSASTGPFAAHGGGDPQARIYR